MSTLITVTIIVLILCTIIGLILKAVKDNKGNYEFPQMQIISTVGYISILIVLILTLFIKSSITNITGREVSILKTPSGISCEELKFGGV